MSSMRVRILGFLWYLGAASGLSAQTYDVPFKAEDFDEGSRKVYWGRAQHSDSGVQEWGYDLGAMRYDAQAKKWTEYAVSDADYTKKNSQWAIYGKNIYAMRDGKVIACWRNFPENPVPGGKHPKVDAGYIYGGGNGYWIQHDDGSRVEYAHMIPGSVPSNLCPHDAVYLPNKIDKPTVEKAWSQIRLDAADQVSIKKGQLLGRVGNAGTSSAPHLHIHVEQGGTATTTKSGGTPVKISFRRGLAAAVENSDSDPSWTSFAGKPIPPGPILIWPPRSLGPEYARHGLPEARFQSWFQHLTDSGFWLTALDTYSVGGKNYVNEVWRPATKRWRAHVLVPAAKHQKNTDDAAAAGFGPILAESSVSHGQPLYSAVFVEGEPGDVIMRHGIGAQEHEKERLSAKARKLVPVSISVVSLNGQRHYTVLYRPGNIGSYEIDSQIEESKYQDTYEKQKGLGRLPVYLNAYMHNGQPFLSAIFASKTPTGGDRRDRHKMSADDFQNEYATALTAKKWTRTVTSFDGAQTQHRFAAAWWK